MFSPGLVNLEKQITFYSFGNNHEYAIVLVFEQKVTVYFAGASALHHQQLSVNQSLQGQTLNVLGRHNV